MIKYAWAGPDDDRTCADVLNDLEEIGTEMGEWRFFIWDDYAVVGWTEGAWPEDFDEDKARAEFFKDIFRVHRVGV